jgi:CubicO group peptidase (beta-lactamase class C family)
MRKFIRRVTIAILSSGLLAEAGTAFPASNNRLAGLDRYIEQARSEWKNVGLAVAVVQDNAVIYSRGFGRKQAGKTDGVDTDTLFQVGSTTKAFTTAALGILVEEGKIRWDDRVIDHLPAFQLQDPWLTRNLTIRDAVTHRSGISFSYYPFLSVMSPDDAVRQLRYVTPEAPFRDSYVYSNLMYAVAGQIVSAASGMPWSEFVSRRLLQPLHMKRSGTSPYDFWDSRYVTPTFLGTAAAGRVDLSNARDPDVAMPHGIDANGSIVVLPWQSYDNAAAAGSLVSGIADMANWLIFHLNDGRFDGNQILKKQTLDELHTTQNLHAGADQFPFDVKTEGYAMGWQRADYRGHTVLSHGGGIIGFPSYVALIPDQKIGVVVLANGPQFPREKLELHRAISLWVMDRLLGAPRRDWRKDYMARAQAASRDVLNEEESLRRARLQNAPPSLPLEMYAGKYEDSRGHSGNVSVQAEQSALTLKFSGSGAYRAELEHWHHDVFRVRSSVGVASVLGPLFATFTVDASGKVASMSLFDASFSRLP